MHNRSLSSGNNYYCFRMENICITSRYTTMPRTSNILLICSCSKTWYRKGTLKKANQMGSTCLKHQKKRLGGFSKHIYIYWISIVLNFLFLLTIIKKVLFCSFQDIELCHYQGKVRGSPGSWAAISTCNGNLTGVIFDGTNMHYVHTHTNPDLEGPYLLYDHSDLVFHYNTNKTCGYAGSDLHNHSSDSFRYSNNEQIQQPNSKVCFFEFICLPLLQFCEFVA